MASRLYNSISVLVRMTNIGRSMPIYLPKLGFQSISMVQKPIYKMPIITARPYSSICFPEIATYEEIKSLPSKPNTLLIDVREPQELQDTGAVPTSINIPLGQVAEKLAAEFPENEFKKLFNRNKPKLDSEIIFMCKIGRRSHNALEISRKLGYKKRPKLPGIVARMEQQ